MKILFVVDYFTPFNPGGSEWSIYYLAQGLKNRGIESIVITPNYGSKQEDVIDGIKVFRFPGKIKIKDKRSTINPIWQNNPLFFLWSSYWIVKLVTREKIDILHVQGKFTIPGAYIAAKLTGKKIIVTIRDKQLLCSLGRCFFEENRYKACGWKEYLTKDLPWFYKNYVKQKMLYRVLYILIGVIWTRCAHSTIAFFAKKVDTVITISNSQKAYLEKNGFESVKVIYNSMIFPKNFPSSRKGILYAGKLSLGKGIFQLLKAIPDIVKKYNEKFIFAGGIDDKDKVQKFIKINKIQKNIELLGGIPHKALQKLYGKVKLVVMPSIYPEAFGRVALESLAVGTPVVVSNRGGLHEIVKNKKTGIICKPDSQSLANSIIEILNNIKKYLENINKEKKNLIKKFELDPINQHILLYKKLNKVK